MCVIMIVDRNDHRPTKQMIDKAWNWNDDGAGIAWREPSKDGKGNEVVYQKGFMSETDKKIVEQMAAELPVPYILHFRIASIDGGGVRQSLTHPFPIDNNTSNDLQGRTKGYVLFHNGNWKGWDETARIAALNK